MRRAVMRRAIAAAIVLAGCTNDVDPPWQLDHDRVIAVRATPPGIVADETAEIDALLGRKGQPPFEIDPDTATVISPTSLADALVRTPTGWKVTVPAPDRLATARDELGLDAGVPVPLRLRLTFAGTDLVGLKAVLLGEHADNPVLDPIAIGTIDGATATELSVPASTDVRLDVDFDDSFVVNWLTSCGTMHDFDLPHAYLRVEPEDPQSGTLGVVVRDLLGGVAWRLWPITAQ
jgi:hypothetical protein